ncbi:MAG: LmbU family transcriptional regulator [Jatrophihabitantaceae bacterium]
MKTARTFDAEPDLQSGPATAAHQHPRTRPPVRQGRAGPPWSTALVPNLPSFANVAIRANGLVLPQSMPFDTWQLLGRQVLSASESMSWWIGDWLVFGEHTYGNRYEEAIAQTSLDYQTLRNYAWIAKKFPMSRRRDALSLGHHSEVAALTEAEQDAWLNRAERFGWSRNDLRRKLRAARNASLPQAKARPIQSVKLEISEEQHLRWSSAAERMKCSVDDWIVRVLDSASNGDSLASAS